MKPNNISNAQIEVWEWKEKAAAEVENIDLKKALDISIMNSIKIMGKLGFKTAAHKYNEVNNIHLAITDNVSKYNSDTE